MALELRTKDRLEMQARESSGNYIGPWRCTWQSAAVGVVVRTGERKPSCPQPWAQLPAFPAARLASLLHHSLPRLLVPWLLPTQGGSSIVRATETKRQQTELKQSESHSNSKAKTASGSGGPLPPSSWSGLEGPASCHGRPSVPREGSAWRSV